MEFTIIEWNINHRLGHSKSNMPMWVADIISKEEADIVILTECSCRVENWSTVKKTAFSRDKYTIFESKNDQGGNNDVVIAVNKKKLNVLYTKSYFSCDHSTPDHLEVKCKCKETGKEFVVVGMRIHALCITDKEKEAEFQLILDGVTDEESVIIGGDFNNNRRVYNASNHWHMTKIDEIINGEFVRKTPERSSIYKDVDTNDNFCFAEDHFLIKGINVDNFTLYPYDRSFAEKNTEIYKWSNDFQKYMGKDENRGNIYNSVPAPYPDHAIIKAKFEL
ncbi:endonuclease/exonuclease/phosphatase family protein [Clostridium estertheticum]|uniref:endonuclease/exonuclease/phosphatase family protein n=1 Tax=Clostridium estertheticum TaxID=238834 RepID=UPI001C0BD1E6|nr:endonuclease/exonuclease/phosphatase family protein [Clostridium estertheticum]MBU3179116.1 endonuclease/exonuclease/phosphatase family protein [Clostridium estertheticum]